MIIPTLTFPTSGAEDDAARAAVQPEEVDAQEEVDGEEAEGHGGRRAGRLREAQKEAGVYDRYIEIIWPKMCVLGCVKLPPITQLMSRLFDHICTRFVLSTTLYKRQHGSFSLNHQYHQTFHTNSKR